MPITPSYPGVYIEEIPSNAHTITPAPTSIAVFIGYSHPFRTKAANFGQAVLLFSFADYERELGGFFASGSISADLPYAVNDFFTNGGSIAYVVGLKAENNLSDGSAQVIAPATATAGGLTLNAREPVDVVPMTITVAGVASSGATADITIVYGHRVETYRGMAFSGVQDALSKVSALVEVTGTAGNGFTAASNISFVNPPLPTGTTLVGTFTEGDFTDAFKENNPLDKVDIFNILVLPGIESNAVLSAALAFAERKRAFALLDGKRAVAADASDGLPTIDADFTSGSVPQSPNGALYFPYLKAQDAITGGPIELPPSGYVAGIYARTDTNRGVWKAPAGLETTVLDTTGVVDRGRMNDLRQGVLNNLGINCLRSFPVFNTVVYGARTLVSANTAYAQWKYVPVRRMALLIEQTLSRELKWAVFEPNDEPLWVALRSSVGGFMLSLFTQGAFQGSKPSQAFVVKCDSTTTTQDDIDRGIVNIIVGFRPLKPAEFVFVKIAQLAGQPA